jgi:ubiquitin C-terminal hydrolase
MPKKLDPAGLIINTLFGLALAEKQCNTCGETKLVTEYHMKSMSTRKHNEDRREQCKDCWYRFNGDSKWGRYILKCEVV